MEGGAGGLGQRVPRGPLQGPSLLRQLCHKGRDMTKLGVLTAAGRGIGGRGRWRWEAGVWSGGVGSALDRGVFSRQPGQGEGCSQEGCPGGGGLVWKGRPFGHVECGEPCVI